MSCGVYVRGILEIISSRRTGLPALLQPRSVEGKANERNNESWKKRQKRDEEDERESEGGRVAGEDSKKINNIK